MQDFPYNFEEDVEHHNIWSTIPLNEKQMLEVGHPHTCFCTLVSLCKCQHSGFAASPIARLLSDHSSCCSCRKLSM